MIPVLFKKNEQQFRTYGLGEITDIINPKVTRERNGQYLLYFQYPQNAEFSDVFEEDMRIKSDAGVRTKWQTFEISRVVRKEGQLIEVFAKHISQSLLKDALNPSVNVRSSNAQQALRIWNNNRIGDEEFDVWSDISTTSSTSWDIRDVSNAFEALAGVQGSILDVWGGEYEFDNKMIRLHKEMGRKSPVPLEYGRNITGLEQDQQDDNVYTSVYPFATYIPESEIGERNEPTTITLPERYIDGKYLDMHNKRKIQVVDFSSAFDYSNPPTIEQLRNLTNQYADANEIGLPHENLKVEYVDLSKTLDYQEFQTMEEVELNDRLPIFYPKFGITNKNAKVVVINYDPVKEENISIELGVIGQSFRTITTGGIGSRLDRIEQQQNETVSYIVNAQGNRIWYTTPDENMEHKIGDTWFEENGQYTRIRVWNGSQWIIEIDTEDIDKNAKAIAEQQQDIEQAQARADEAVEQINTAVANAGHTSLDETISSVQSISNQAQINSGTAINNALEAMQQASLAVDNTGSLNVRVDEVENTLSVKADKQTVDDLTGVVDSQALDIQANAQGLALKANQSTVDTLAGTVSSLGTEFDVIAGQVSSKVWMADIDDIEIGGRNYFVIKDALENTVIAWATGRPGVETGALASGFIPVSKNEEFVLNHPTSQLFYYDENKINIPLGMMHGGRVIKVPNNDDIAYMRVSFRDNFLDGRSKEDVRVMIGKGSKITDWSQSPEDTDAKFDYIETEWTQTFDTFSQTVAGIDGRVTAQKQTIDSITSTVADNTGRISTTEQTIDGLQDTVYDPETGLTSVNTQLANLVNIAVTGDELSGALSVLEDNLNLRLVAKDEVIAQINLSNENILIQSNRILLDGDVTVSGTAWLPGAVIADASIDTAQIADLAVSSAKIVSLDVSKLSGNHMEFITGAFTASNGDISITGRQIQINSIDYANMRLNRNNVEFSRSDGIIVGGLVATHNPYVSGSNLGLTLLSARSGQVAGIGRHLGSGSHTPSISVSGTSGNIEVHNNMTMDTNVPFYFRSGGYLVTDSNNMIIRNTNDTSAFRIDVGAVGSINNTIASFNRSGIQHYRNMSMNNNNILAINTIDSLNRMTNVGSIEALWYRGPRNEQVYFGVNRDGSSVTSFRLQHDGMRMYQSVNWNGNNLHAVGSINYASDARLKEIIGTRTEDDLATIMAINYKNYYRSGSKERGFIAQELQLIDSDLITVGENGMLGYDGQGYVHTIGHAVQQLALKELNTNLLASENRTLIEELQQENKELRNRLEELESAA